MMDLLASVVLLFLATAVNGSGGGSGWNLEADRRNRILKDTWTKDFNPHKTLGVRPDASFSTVKKAYLNLRQQSSSRSQPWKADHAYAMLIEKHIEENHFTQAEKQSMSMNEAIDDLAKSWIFLAVCLVVAALLVIIIRQHFAPEEPLTISTSFLDVTADLSKSAIADKLDDFTELDHAFTEEATLFTPCPVNTPPAQRLFSPEPEEVTIDEYVPVDTPQVVADTLNDTATSDVFGDEEAAVLSDSETDMEAFPHEPTPPESNRENHKVDADGAFRDSRYSEDGSLDKTRYSRISILTKPKRTTKSPRQVPLNKSGKTIAMPVKSDVLPPVAPPETFYGVYIGRRGGCVFFLVTETRHGFGTRVTSQSTWKARCELSSDAARSAADNFVEANGLKEGRTPCRLAEAGRVLKAQTGYTEIGLRKWAADMASLAKRTCECARARRK